MSILFISDLHLHPQRPKLTCAFTLFCQQQLTPPSQLYILGDLFEAWLGDDLGLEMYADVVALLAQQTQRGIPIYFMPGNRDFLVGSAFSQATGVTLLPDHHLLRLGQEQVLLLHGDTLCTEDRDYQDFRQMVRQPQWQADFLAKPVLEREAIVSSYRQQSNTMTTQKSETIMDVCPVEVIKQMQHHGCNILIHGHTHRPRVHLSLAGAKHRQRIVLGDWQQHYHYLHWPPDGKWKLIQTTI